jgi:hypothetical protein
MRSAIKIIVAISFVTLAVLIILPIIFLYLKISLGGVVKLMGVETFEKKFL